MGLIQNYNVEGVGIVPAPFSDMEDEAEMRKKDQEEFDRDFVIIIDTREQDEYKFKGTLTVRDKIDAGDYSIQGFEREIVIERKSLLDFIGSISRDRERFKESLRRMKDVHHKYIVVEGQLSECLDPIQVKSGSDYRCSQGLRPIVKNYIKVHPNAVFQSVVAISLQYDIRFFFAMDRKQAEEFVYSTLKKFLKYKREGKI